MVDYLPIATKEHATNQDFIFKGQAWPLKTKALRSFKTSDTTNPCETAPRHKIPELNPQSTTNHCPTVCKTLKMYYSIRTYFDTLFIYLFIHPCFRSFSHLWLM
jgi:hypothetical protein